MRPLSLIRQLSAAPAARHLFATTAWSAMAELSSKGLMLLAMVLVARIIGTESYGELGLLRTMIGMFATIGGVGLGLTANRYVAGYRATDKTHCGRIIGSSYLLATTVGFLVALGVFAGAGYLARDVLAAPQLEGALKVAAVLVFLGAVNGAQTGVLQGLDAYRLLAVSSAAQGIGGFLMLVAGSYYFGVIGALAALVGHSLGGVVLFRHFIRQELRRQSISTSFRDLSTIMPTFWSFSVPAVLMALAVAPFKWLAETALSKSSGFHELGLFHAAMTFANVFLALVSTLNAPLLSFVASRQTSASPRIQYFSLYGSWYLFLCLAAPCLIFPRLPGVFFGGQYVGTQLFVVSLLLLLYSGLLLYYQGVMRAVTLHGSMWFGLFTNLCEGISLIAVFFQLRHKGVIGLGIAYVASYVVRVAVTTPFLIRRKIVPPSLLFDRYFAVTLGALVVVIALEIARIS